MIGAGAGAAAAQKPVPQHWKRRITRNPAHKIS
jgi:hypothetical protein